MIPVLLMLAYPPGYPIPRPPQGAQPLASDADRDITVDILCAAVGDGRLTLAELEERVGAALSARTRTELAALVADLPGRPSRQPAQSPEPTGGAGDRSRNAAGDRSRSVAGDRSRSGAGLRPADPDYLGGRPTPLPSRWALLQSLIDARAATGSAGWPATVG